MPPKFTHIEMRYPDGHVEKRPINELEDRERELFEAITDLWFVAEEWDLELDDRPAEAAIVLEAEKARNCRESSGCGI